MPHVDRYCKIIILCYNVMSQISLKCPKPETKSCLNESEAKGPLSSNSKNSFAYTDVAGLSWIFLDDPLNIKNYA